MYVKVTNPIKDVDVLVYDVDHQLLLGEGDEEVVDLPFHFSEYHFVTISSPSLFFTT
jgi:hypothetical protein